MNDNTSLLPNYKKFTLEYQGPTYLYSIPHILQRVKELKFALGQSRPGPVEIFYAMKANSHLDILRAMVAEGLGLDVVSAGELRRGLECGCPPQRIIFSGVGKTHSDLHLAISLGIRQINVESLPELERVVKVARALQVKQISLGQVANRAKVALRVNPDVDVATHPYIATGLKENKFGIETSALGLAEGILNRNRDVVEFQGFSLHIGSQIHDLESYREAYQKIAPLVKDWQSRAWIFKSIDGGGGLGIFYDRQALQEEVNLANTWGEILRTEWRDFNLMVEPGRWLVAHGGMLMTRIEYVKQTSEVQFVIVDTGMHHLLRPALYEAQHRMQLLDCWGNLVESNEELETYQVVGPICESSDVLCREIKLPKKYVVEGAYLLILDAGAYGFSMASDYNLHEKPKELFV